MLHIIVANKLKIPRDPLHALLVFSTILKRVIESYFRQIEEQFCLFFVQNCFCLGVLLGVWFLGIQFRVIEKHVKTFPKCVFRRDLYFLVFLRITRIILLHAVLLRPTECTTDGIKRHIIAFSEIFIQRMAILMNIEQATN